MTKEVGEMPHDTIEAIEKDLREGPDLSIVSNEYYELQIRILIQIAYQLRVIAQKGVT